LPAIAEKFDGAAGADAMEEEELELELELELEMELELELEELEIEELEEEVEDTDDEEEDKDDDAEDTLLSPPAQPANTIRHTMRISPRNAADSWRCLNIMDSSGEQRGEMVSV
jgi:hypothetical protein